MHNREQLVSGIVVRAWWSHGRTVPGVLSEEVAEVQVWSIEHMVQAALLPSLLYPVVHGMGARTAGSVMGPPGHLLPFGHSMVL